MVGKLQVGANILVGNGMIIRKVLEQSEKEVTYWPLVICYGPPNSVDGIRQW